MSYIETSRLLLKEYNPTLQRELLRSPQKKQIDFFGGKGFMEYLALRAQFLEPFIHNNRQTFKHWLIIEKASGKIIGDCGFHRWYHLQQVAEVGYGLRASRYMNKGYMSEVLEQILTVGFTRMDLRRVEAFVKPDNPASLKLLHKMGFTAEGRLEARYDRGASDLIILRLQPENFTNRFSDLPYWVQAFERKTLPPNWWTHETHLKVGLWYALNLEYNAALIEMRTRLMAYNTVAGIPNSSERGYHETLTQFWLMVMKKFISQNKLLSYQELLDSFLASEWASRLLPFKYYKRERLYSVEARATFLPPQLKEL